MPMPVLCVQREPSRKIEEKKDEEDGCFPIIQHHRFQVLRITENQFRKQKPSTRLLPLLTSVFLVLLCTCIALLSSVYTYLVAYSGPFRNYGRG